MATRPFGKLVEEDGASLQERQERIDSLVGKLDALDVQFAAEHGFLHPLAKKGQKSQPDAGGHGFDSVEGKRSIRDRKRVARLLKQMGGKGNSQDLNWQRVARVCPASATQKVAPVEVMDWPTVMKKMDDHALPLKAEDQLKMDKHRQWRDRDAFDEQLERLQAGQQLDGEMRHVLRTLRSKDEQGRDLEAFAVETDSKLKPRLAENSEDFIAYTATYEEEKVQRQKRDLVRRSQDNYIADKVQEVTDPDFRSTFPTNFSYGAYLETVVPGERVFQLDKVERPPKRAALTVRRGNATQDDADDEEAKVDRRMMSRQGKAAKERQAQRFRLAIFTFEQARGFRYFLKFWGLLSINNILIITINVSFMADVYPSRGAGVVRDGVTLRPRDLYPLSAFIFAGFGTVGMGLMLASLLSLRIVVAFKGLSNARKLRKPARVLVYTFYAGIFLNLHAIISQAQMIKPLLERIQLDLKDANGDRTNLPQLDIEVALKTVAAIVVIPMQCCTLVLAYFMVYGCVARMVEIFQLMRHMANSVQLCIAASCVLLFGFASVYVQKQVEVTSRTVFGFLYRGAYGFTTLGAVTSFFYGQVARFQRRTDRHIEARDKNKDEIASVLDPHVAPGEFCRLKSVKPELKGCRVKVVKVPTSGDTVVVQLIGPCPQSMRDREVRVHYYQLEPDKEHDELLKLKIHVEAEQLELEENLRNKQRMLSIWIKIYMVVLQVIISLGIFYFMLIYLLNEAAAVSMFSDMLEQNAIEAARSATNASQCLDDGNATCTDIQEMTCEYWRTCEPDATSIYCAPNVCVISATITYEPPSNSATIVSAVALTSALFSGAIGYCFAGWLAKSNTAARWGVVVLIAASGGGVGALSANSYMNSGAGYDYCAALDLFPEIAGDQRLSTQCVERTSAYMIHEQFVTAGGDSLVAGVLSLIVFLVQSGLLISVWLQRIDRDKFAVFQFKVSCGATTLAMLVWLGISLVYELGIDEETNFLQRTKDWSYEMAHKMQIYDEAYGTGFPLYVGHNLTVFLLAQEKTEFLWLEITGVASTAGPVILLQLVGFVVACGDRRRWWLIKHLLHLHVCWLAYCLFLIYELTYVVSVLPNTIGLMMVMTMPPFFFSCVAAVQSGIYPINTHSYVRLAIETLARLVLIACLFSAFVGGGMWYVANLAGDESSRTRGKYLVGFAAGSVFFVFCGFFFSTLTIICSRLKDCLERVLSPFVLD